MYLFAFLPAAGLFFLERIMSKEFVYCGLMKNENILSDGVVSLIPDGRYAVFPGFCDVHVHFREPGFSYKETIKTGSLAAARGGYTSVCAMPNLDPCPDSPEHLGAEQEIIDRDAVIGVYPYGSITVGKKGAEIVPMERMACAIAFSDDGHGVQNEKMMERAMLRAKACGKIIAAHCEDNSKLNGGYIHDGDYAREHGHAGISSESEWSQVERDLYLAEKTGCAYHVCHISTAESVRLIRRAKNRGVDVTCETAPHYLILDDACLKEDGRFKMNPPLRSASDREALVGGLLDGTVDMIATDHAPHTADEKSRGLKGSPFGVVGLETAFPSLYTFFVREKIISADRLTEMMCLNPRRRFGIKPDGFSIWNLEERFTVDPAAFLSAGKATPFEGMEMYGVNYATFCRGRAVYINKTCRENSYGKENRS